MYSIIVFTQEELENKFRELEEKHKITREMFFKQLNFPNTFNYQQKINPKHLKVGTYTKIVNTLFDAEKNPEKYYIANNITKTEENTELSFIDSIIAGIPSVDTIAENNLQEKFLENKQNQKEKKPIDTKSIKMEPEDFKFLTGSFGNPKNTETEEKSEEENQKIFTEKTESGPDISHLIPKKPKREIHISIDGKDIEILQKFTKQILLMEGKIERGKPSKYSLASIRDEYNIFVKKLEKKYYQNFSEYYILQNIYDDITMEYYFPDNAGTRKIINLLSGKLISQKNLQESSEKSTLSSTGANLINPLMPQIVESITFSHTSTGGIRPIRETKINQITPIQSEPLKNPNPSSGIVSPRTGKTIIVKRKVEPKKKKKEDIITEPQSYFAAIKQCADRLKYEIEENNIKEIPLSLVELFHTRLAKIETETGRDLSEYYIKKDHTNILTGELVYPSARDAMSKIYTCAGHLYVNKI